MGSASPSIVIGVGGAGIDVINCLHESDGFGWGEQYDENFEYVVIDTNESDLMGAPERATKVFLELPDTEQIEKDRERYPYLSADVEIKSYGTERQRRVGRYRLDNTAPPSWEDLTAELRGVIESHVEGIVNDNTRPNELNIIHVHSLSGGTGSGTFPLVAHLINELTEDIIEERPSLNVYTTGIGTVSQLTHSLDTVSPSGDVRLYVNTYAALRDLERLAGASPNNPVPIYRYATAEDFSEENHDDSTSKRVQTELTSNPYDHYFLMGIDESQVSGTNGSSGPETYREMIDNTIAGAIYGIAMRNPQFATFDGGTRDGGGEQFGTFDHAQLSVPIEDVRTICNLTKRIRNLQDEVGDEDDGNGTLHEMLAENQDRRDRLEQYADDPERALARHGDPEVIQHEIEEHIDRYIERGDRAVEATMDDVDALLSDLKEAYDEYVLPVALDRIIDRIETHETATENLSKFVAKGHQELDLPDTEPSNDHATAVHESQLLHDHLVEEIERIEERLDPEGRNLPGFLRFFVNAPLRRKLKRYRSRLQDLEERQHRYKEVQTLLETIRERRESLIETEIKEIIERLDREIAEQRTEIERKQDELKTTRKHKRETIDRLTTGEYGSRLGYDH